MNLSDNGDNRNVKRKKVRNIEGKDQGLDVSYIDQRRKRVIIPARR